MAFVNFAPQFGAAPQGDHLNRIMQSENFSNGQFQNQIPTFMDLGFRNGSKVMYEWIFNAEGREPSQPIPVAFKPASDISDSTLSVVWYGHSAVLLKMDGKKILLDPMLGEAAAPVSFMTRRFQYQEPIQLDKFSDIDAVIISHDHYDHLDYKSILKLKDKVQHFFTALGVGAHLKRWGVDSTKITELDWWESVNYDHLQFVAAPARHFSGRGLNDRNKTQWASWIIAGKKEKVYFSGDSGYGPHFKEIGERYGPFDFAMMECGQYNLRWEAIHMLPEQTIQAGKDIKCKSLMPIHWGAFNLSLHTWTEPVERALKAADSEIDVITPTIGEEINPTHHQGRPNHWWRDL